MGEDAYGLRSTNERQTMSNPIDKNASAEEVGKAVFLEYGRRFNAASLFNELTWSAMIPTHKETWKNLGQIVGQIVKSAVSNTPSTLDNQPRYAPPPKPSRSLADEADKMRAFVAHLSMTYEPVATQREARERLYALKCAIEEARKG